jgi:hypothetical protein
MKNPFAVAARTEKYTSIDQIMKDDVKRAKLTNLVDEALKCKSKIDFEKDNLKALREMATNELGVKPKLFNAYLSAVYNNDYAERHEGLEEQLSLLERIMLLQGIEFTSTPDSE